MFAACVLQCVGKHREKGLQLWLELKEKRGAHTGYKGMYTRVGGVCARTCMCMECVFFCVMQVYFVQTNLQ